MGFLKKKLKKMLPFNKPNPASEQIWPKREIYERIYRGTATLKEPRSFT